VPRALWRFDRGVAGGRGAQLRAVRLRRALVGPWPARAPMTMSFWEVGAVPSAAGQLPDRASPWPGCDQRETRLAMRVRDVVAALMRCRS
jgi:hypothetical protein